MKIDDYFHLTYCTNIHPGESWPEVRANLDAALPRVRTHLRAPGPFAIGLRLSARAAETLDHADEVARFQRFLRDADYYVPTVNGFPYGAFHAVRVKERVYLPDWRQRERLVYTNRLAGLLARLPQHPDLLESTVSTVPGAFRAAVESDADVDAIADAMVDHAAFLVALRQRTGVTVTLGIEPEPACLIETVADAVDFFEKRLFNRQRIRTSGDRTGVPLTMEDVQRHVGICFDACHMAVEFEDPSDAIDRLDTAGIRIVKVQLSSALRLPAGMPHASVVAALEPFADDTYLHQVVRRGPRGTDRFTDLPEALSAAPEADREWRVHFHVPIFLADMTGFETTQSYLRSVLDLMRRKRLCPLLEVETYTWTVLPPAYRGDMCAAIARELEWVRRTLQA